MQWNTEQIKQCENLTGQVLLKDKQVLDSINQDFGHLVRGGAEALFKPSSLSSLQKILQYATQKKLPVTLRAKGLSQSGQSLAIEGGITIDIHDLNTQLEWVDGSLIVGCSVPWKEIIATALQHQQIPKVCPYNTNLSLGGVISVGGIGSSSFKEGIIAGHIESLEVITADGTIVSCSPQQNKDLFNACLCGTGLFGVIYSAKIRLRFCKDKVRVQTLIYDNYQRWIEDQFFLRQYCDYLEAFIAPNPEGGAADKVCMLQIGIEYDNTLPQMAFLQQLGYAQKGLCEDKTLWEYAIRHDPRLDLMKENGAWSELHPWYECYVDCRLLLPRLDELVKILDDGVGGIYHVFPVAPQVPRYFMIPRQEKIVTFNMLIPGVKFKDINNALAAIKKVDSILLQLGGKRYISGWFPPDKDERYWQSHYEACLLERNETKAKYDPASIFCSKLFPDRLV